MKKQNVTDVIRGLSWLTEAELLEVNKVVVSTIRQIRRNIGVTAGTKFHIGDKVSFASSRTHTTLHGVITKVNRVNAVVKVFPTMNIQYRVPFTMLTRSK